MLLTLLWLVVFVWIAYTDLFYRLISNFQILIVLILGLLSAFYYSLDLHILAALIALFIGMICWNLNIVGAGDIKLLTLLVLFLPSSFIWSFLFLVSLIGVFIALCVWVAHKIFHTSKTLPYGIAIMSAFLIFFLAEIA